MATPTRMLAHVNLMIDTFIANANTEDLRAIIRSTLAASPPVVASALTAAARYRLSHTSAAALPLPDDLVITSTSANGRTIRVPSSDLPHVLARTRALYGAGMGIASLRILAVVVRAMRGMVWDEGSELEGTLASIDADISQAIQSAREEIDGGRVADIDAARAAAQELRAAVSEARKHCGSGRGGYPFEQGAIALQFWRL